MSYLLDAIQKASRESKEGQSPCIDQILSSTPVQDQVAGSGFSGGLVRLILLGACVAAVVVGLLLASADLLPLRQAVEQAPAAGQSGFTAPDRPDPVDPVAVNPAPAPQLQRELAAPAQPSVALPDKLIVEGVLLFAHEPQRSRVIVGGSSFAIGQELDAGWLIQDMDDEQIYLLHSQTGQEYLLRY